MSTLFVNNLNTASGSTITVPTSKKLIVTDGGGLKVPGTVVQVVQGTRGELGGQNASNIVLINQSFTPKFSGSKFYVDFMIPNLTGGQGNYFQAKAYIGVDSTPLNNTEVIYCRHSGQGTAANDAMTLNGSDFGTYTAPNTNTHYVSLLCTTSGTWTLARHSATMKLQCMEIEQ